MALPIALQLYTVRHALAEDFEGTLERVAGIGYRQVEFAGLAGRDASEVRGLLDRLGLSVTSAHASLERLTGALDEEIEQARILGHDALVCSSMPGDLRTSEGYVRGREELDAAAGRAAEAGIRIGYHNHAFEFEKLADGSRGIDRLFDEPGRFFSELDTCWVARGGADPVAWLRKLEGRAPLVHVKDTTAGKDPQFVEIGDGILSIAATVRAAERAGAEVLIVEQDNHWRNDDPLESAKVSYDNLVGIIGE